MSDLATYFQMDGYAMFVWPAYALAFCGIVGVLWISLKSWKAREMEFDELKSARNSDERTETQP
jgi:heme exporter protein CcmD